LNKTFVPIFSLQKDIVFHPSNYELCLTTQL